MTLILSLAMPAYVLQVSDRRETYFANGKIKRTNVDKTVLYCNQLTFGFTGPTILEKTDTAHWLAKRIVETPENNLKLVSDHIAQRATAALRRSELSPRDRRLAFVGVGWYPAQCGQIHPIVVRITNFHDPKSLHNPPVARDTFIVQHRIHNPPVGPTWSWGPTGVDLTAAERKQLGRNLKLCAKHGGGPSNVVRLFVEMIRQVAKRTSTVGKDVLITMIPKGAAGLRTIHIKNAEWKAGLILSQARDDDRAEALKPENSMVFSFLPKDATSFGGDAFGPLMACPGGSLTGGLHLSHNVEMTPLRASPSRVVLTARLPKGDQCPGEP